MNFRPAEIRDLAVAWVALALAFTFFILQTNPGVGLLPPSNATVEVIPGVFLLAFLTAGVGFLLHELAHKVVAVRFGQVAAFRADYTMLGLAIFAGLAGFLFAAPGAVYHSGRITERQNGLIALAGPVTNVALAFLFFPLLAVGGYLGDVGQMGFSINAALAAFNMIPFGPLDGRKVKDWSLIAFVAGFIGCAGLAVFAVFVVGFPI